jgi:hypothetical protein
MVDNGVSLVLAEVLLQAKQIVNIIDREIASLKGKRPMILTVASLAR